MNSAPFERDLRFIVRKHNPRFTITKENYTVDVLYIPGLVLCMVCFLLQTEAGVNRCHLQHGHCSAGLCDDVPWLGNSGPE